MLACEKHKIKHLVVYVWHRVCVLLAIEKKRITTTTPIEKKKKWIFASLCGSVIEWKKGWSRISIYKSSSYRIARIYIYIYIYQGRTASTCIKEQLEAKEKAKRVKVNLNKRYILENNY
jgi:hypothetical protein